MKKKILLSLCASIAIGASAATYNQGEAFAYAIDQSFSFDLTGEDGELYAQYPAMGLQGQASIEYGFGLASAWFNNKQFANPAEANEYCPIVADPWNESGYVLRMQTTAWDGFGNFNFALPQTDVLSRVRVIYRVNTEGVENIWYNGGQKPFHVKLMNDNDQDTPDYPEINEQNEEFWNNPGWRVADFVINLNSDEYYLSLLWDAAGLSCQRNVPFYVKEVSVVPVDNIKGGYTIPDGNKSLTITQEMPELVNINEGGADLPEGVYALGEGFCYDFDTTFSFGLTGEDGELYAQYPAMGLQGQADITYGFGLASVWFNAKKFANPAEANEYCPIVADPWNEGSYVLRMQTSTWDGFGNFNFALPQTDALSRVRVIYRVNTEGVENAWYNGGQKPFHVKLMNDNDQDTPDYPEINELNEEFWNNPGWRVADFVINLNSDEYYLSLLWDAGGLSCGRNVPFYVKEVSVVPVDNIKGGYTIPDGNQSLTISQEMPTLVKVDRSGGAGIQDVNNDANGAAIVGIDGAVAVTGYVGTVEVYNLMGQHVGSAYANGNANIATPAGIVIVKAGNTVAKVVVR